MKTNIKSEVSDGTRKVDLIGSINAVNAESVHDAVLADVGKWEEPCVVLGLKNVDYVSSAALRIFMELWKAGGANQVEVMLADPTTDVREVLELTGFQNIFKIIESG